MIKYDDMPDVYILGRAHDEYQGVVSPMVFYSHEAIEDYLRNGWCTETIGFSMEVLKHADWHGAGLIKLTHNERKKTILFRVYVSKIYGKTE